MLRKRSYALRGKTIYVDEVYDIKAVRASVVDHSGFALDEKQVSEYLNESNIKKDYTNYTHFEIYRFIEKGWRFYKASVLPDTLLKKHIYSVLISAENHLLLFGGVFTLQFSENLSEQEVLELLASYDCEVIRQLPFAKRMYRVRSINSTHSDVFTLMETMNSSDHFQFAEPDFIQLFGPRS